MLNHNDRRLTEKPGGDMTKIDNKASAGAARRADRGITDDAILFGMENPMGSFSADLENLGFRLAFQEANDHGSIHGRRIEWRGYPRQGGSTSVQAANFRRLIEEDQVFAVVNFAGGDVTDLLVQISRENRTPYLFPHSGLVSSAGERYLFASYPNLESEARIMFRYLAQERGVGRIAIAHDPNIYGMFYVERLKRYASLFGYALVGAAPITSREPGDLTEQMRELIGTRPDAIFMGLYPAQAKAVMEAKGRLNWTGMMVSSGPLTDEQYLNLPQGGAEGTIGFCYYPDPNISTEPGFVTYRAALARYYPGSVANRYSLYGYVYGKIIIEGLRRTGRDLTRENFIDAMETITDWDSGGIMPDVTFSKVNHHAQPTGFIGGLRNGRFVPLSGWIQA